MIPSPSSYPSKMDDDDNLFLVHDALRLRLSEDYNPGDTVVRVEDDALIFPETGIITLTEQCSDIDQRALSFYYSARTRNTFEGLEILPEFAGLNCPKPKKATNVTMNVVSMHHNHLKDALVAVQRFVGPKYGEENPTPPSSPRKRKETITGRIEHLQSVVFSPKAWFSSDVSYGLVPLKVNFKNESLRMGEGACRQTWDFGDGTTVVLETNDAIEYASTVSREKTYSIPGVYTVKLSVQNEYGSDEVEFEEMVVARTDCPEEASINIIHRASQDVLAGGGIRSAAGTFVDFEVREGEDPDRPGYSYAGEVLSSGTPIDPVVEYTWNLGDDLPHANSRFARASYDLGGYYDITLRVDTSFGSYRITTNEKAIDIIEKSNLWLFNQETYGVDSSGSIKAYEFGLKSETFKVLGNTEPIIDRSSLFLNNPPLDYDSSDYYFETASRAKREFEANSEFARSGSSFSGEEGKSLLFWAKGGASLDSKEIGVKRYEGFGDTYENLTPINNRPWNWVAMSSRERTYFLFGQAPILPGQNRAVAERVEYDMATQSAGSPVALNSSDFENGADELLSHPSYYENGVATSGYFASYRTAWKDQTGYILRNSSVNEFFRFGDFYRTKGSISSPVGSITKMPDMPGSIKTEGQLVSLSNGVFFFNNSGEVCAWNDTSLVWEVGRASSTSLSFRSVQDSSAQNFDDKSNTLKASSDGDRAAYLSYDYSSKAFVKFNGTDLTFTLLRQRPEGKQFKIGVY